MTLTSKKIYGWNKDEYPRKDMPWTSGTKNSNPINIIYQEFNFTENFQYRSHNHKLA